MNGKWIIVIVAAVALFFLGLVLVIHAQPDEYGLERSRVIDASADEIYPHIADFEQWKEWSPWLVGEDYEASTTGEMKSESSTFEWHGEEIGAGRLTLADTDRPHRLAIDLRFLEPHEMDALTTFELRSLENDQTQVTWSMRGQNNFMSKAIGLVMDLEDMIGDDYEEGLDNLARRVEG